MRKIRSLAMECNSLLDKLEECTQKIDSTSNRKEKKKCQIEVSQMKSEIKQKAFEFMSALLDDKAVRWAFSVRIGWRAILLLALTIVIVLLMSISTIYTIAQHKSLVEQILRIIAILVLSVVIYFECLYCFNPYSRIESFLLGTIGVETYRAIAVLIGEDMFDVNMFSNIVPCDIDAFIDYRMNRKQKRMKLDKHEEMNLFDLMDIQDLISDRHVLTALQDIVINSWSNTYCILELEDESKQKYFEGLPESLQSAYYLKKLSGKLSETPRASDCISVRTLVDRVIKLRRSCTIWEIMSTEKRCAS